MDERQASWEAENAKPLWRCNITGNPCGTDTVREGYHCDCKSCRMWMAERGINPNALILPSPQQQEMK